MLHLHFPIKLGGQKVGLMHGASRFGSWITVKSVQKSPHCKILHLFITAFDKGITLCPLMKIKERLAVARKVLFSFY